jgi:hypothetical protein
MLTEDERALMIATICLHGFELYERFDTDGVWRPLLVGQYVTNRGGGPLFEAVVQWKDKDKIADRRSLTAISRRWQKHHWFKLTDQQLTDFHRTVISTC